MKLHQESPLSPQQYDAISSILAKIGRDSEPQDRLREMGSAALKQVIQLKAQLAVPGEATDLSEEVLFTIEEIVSFCETYIKTHPEPKESAPFPSPLEWEDIN